MGTGFLDLILILMGSKEEDNGVRYQTFIRNYFVFNN